MWTICHTMHNVGGTWKFQTVEQFQTVLSRRDRIVGIFRAEEGCSSGSNCCSSGETMSPISRWFIDNRSLARDKTINYGHANENFRVAAIAWPRSHRDERIIVRKRCNPCTALAGTRRQTATAEGNRKLPGQPCMFIRRGCSVVQLNCSHAFNVFRETNSICIYVSASSHLTRLKYYNTMYHEIQYTCIVFCVLIYFSFY